jgi:hypothetical protein
MVSFDNLASTYLSFIDRLSRRKLRSTNELAATVLPLHWKITFTQFRFLDLFMPFHGWFPCFRVPHQQLAFSVRAIWTLCALGVLLILQQTPIYGFHLTKEDVDFLIWLKPIFLCSHGTV